MIRRIFPTLLALLLCLPSQAGMSVRRTSLAAAAGGGGGAITFDSSTPAVASSNGAAVTTAAFNPPNNSLLVACVMSNSNTGQNITITMSNNGSAVTWTNQVERDLGDGGAVRGHASIWTTPLTTGRTGMTVTATSNTGSGGIGMKVFVITGHDTSSPIGAVGEGSSTTNNITPNALTTTVNAVRVLGCAGDWNDLGLPTTTDTGYAFNASGYDGIAVHKAADTASAGTTVTLNFDAGGTGAPEWNWVAVEVKSAS